MAPDKWTTVARRPKAAALSGPSGPGLAVRQITSRLTSASSLSAILDVYKRHGSAFDEINIVTAWNRLGSVRATGHERAGFFREEERTLLQLLQHTERLIPRLDARGIANACMLRHGPAPLRASARNDVLAWRGGDRRHRQL
jgi:hypothetical protein